MASVDGKSQPKPVPNGIDGSAASGGFRHQLPQIAAVRSRSSKIAQSKVSGMEIDAATLEQSTMEVEGVGKVVHIGSELMETGDAQGKKLLEELDNNIAAGEEEKEGQDKPGRNLGRKQNNSVPSNGNLNQSGTKVKETTGDAGTGSPVGKKQKGRRKSEQSPNKKDTNQNKLQSAVDPTKDGSEIKETAAIPSDQAKGGSEVKQIADKSLDQAKGRSEVKQIADKSLDQAKGGSEVGQANQIGKRQRKPKKLEVEEVETPKTPKTPKEKEPKPTLETSLELEAQYPVQYLVGDVVWSKVTGHPWWPSMISYDPYTALSTRVTCRKNMVREYHVQFFGEAPERAWVRASNLLEFQGKAKFDEHAAKQIQAAAPKERSKIKKLYEVTESKAKAVNISIADAEIALPMSRNDRKATYTFVYHLPSQKGKLQVTPTKLANELAEDVKIIKGVSSEGNKKHQSNAKKRKHSEVATPESTKTKRRKVEPVKTPSTKQSKTPSPSKSSKKVSSVHRPAVGTEASFDVFCQKERDVVMIEHPDFTEDMLLDFCRQQWCMMSKKQKARYKSKHSTGESGDDPSPRKRKPTQKMLESEENIKALDEALSGKKSSPAPEKHTKLKEKTSRRSSLANTTSSSEVKSESVKKRGRPKKSVDPHGAKEETLPTTDVKKGSLSTTDVKKGRKSLPAEPVKAQIEEVSAAEKRVTPEEDAADLLESQPIKTSTLIPAKKVSSIRPKKPLSETDAQSESENSDTPSLDPVPAPKPKEEYEYTMELYKLSTAGPQKKENLCQICEQTGELLECEGPCQGFFHADCLGLSGPPSGAFTCDECTNGIHSCFVCKRSDATTQRCSVPVCGKFYHADCVKQFPQAKFEGKGIFCPLHNCHTCFANNMNAAASKSNGRLLRCVRCPTAYHVGDFCIAAGSINLTGFNIVCAKHFQPIPSQKHHSHINVAWCFICNKGGTLLCCETCPAVFHAECLNIEFPTGSWSCADCVKGKRPLYGEIVWVKLGIYRWWPGEICHPRNVPLNIQEKAHQVGEFPVHFLGSHDYFWLHQGRVFAFQDGDKGNAKASSSCKGLSKPFAKGLVEATDAYKLWMEFQDNKVQLEMEKNNKKPAPFKMVKTNIPLGKVTINKADLSELPRCDCKVTQENPCSRDSDCLNYMMLYECHPALCPAAEKCQNQFFTKRQYPPQQPHKTDERGWGLMAMADIKKGQFVNEYVGDLIDEEECKRRIKQAHDQDVHNFYMMTLDADRIIDAGPKGNMSRFMNHSCQPNLETQKWNVNGDVRVGLFALRDIKQGEEITFNYNFDCLGNERTKCGCGAENCSGYLGVRPKSQNAATVEAKGKEAKLNKLKKKKKLVVKQKHDDDCFRCGEGGELVMCDRGSCPKSYHLHCLGLDKPPHGKWDCPWHHCDDCGKPVTRKCVECPSSYCATHSDGNVKIFDNKPYCLEHEELLEILAESQSQSSNNSDEVSDNQRETGSNNGKKAKTENGEKLEKQTAADVVSKQRDEPVLPPKKRAKLTPSEKSGGKQVNGGGKASKGKKLAKGGDKDTKGPIADDALAVAPMFDDSEEEEFGLVIDIPNF